MLTLYLEEWTHVVLAHSFNVADKETAEKAVANKRHVKWLDVTIKSTDRKRKKKEEPNSLTLTQIYTHFFNSRGNGNIMKGVFDSFRILCFAWAYYRHNYGL